MSKTIYQRIYDCMNERPWIGVSDVADELGISRSYVTSVLSKNGITIRNMREQIMRAHLGV